MWHGLDLVGGSSKMATLIVPHRRNRNLVGRLSGLASRHSDPIPAGASDETVVESRMCGILAELDRSLHV